MDNRIDAAYARQSVDKKDSISIESQFEFCGYELKGGTFKPYKDKGYSGKNTDRPDFQSLLRDIRAGLIRRVVVYKLDRISRSIIDFANMMELFQRYKVEFVSCQEKFDTSTPMGRAMLNICIVFAQLERETIQMRVTDAYYSRCSKGYKMGGKTPFGFDTESFTIQGIKTKRLIADSDMENVRLAFGMYAEPEISLGDIARWYAERGIRVGGSELQRVTLSRMFRNPVYVKADMAVYEFFKSRGVVIVNDPVDFVGTNGCYLYKGRDMQKRDLDDLTGQMLVIAPHLGEIDSDVWLKCRRKTLNNKTYQPARKAKNTWLAGKVKCGRCGYALASATGINGTRYLRCTKRAADKSCEGAGKMLSSDLEATVYAAMSEKLSEFHTLTARARTAEVNPKLTALKVELAHVEAEIDKLLDTLTGANDVLISYVNVKIAELDSRRQTLVRGTAELAAAEVSPGRMIKLSKFLDNWDGTGIDEKRGVVDALIERIGVAGGECGD